MSTRRPLEPPYPYTHAMRTVAPAPGPPPPPPSHAPQPHHGLVHHPNLLVSRIPSRDLPPLREFSMPPSREISPEKSPGYSFQSSSRIEDLGSVFGYFAQPGPTSMGPPVDATLAPQSQPTPPQPSTVLQHPSTAQSVFWAPPPVPPPGTVPPSRLSPPHYVETTYEQGFSLSPSASGNNPVDDDIYVRAAARAADNAKLQHRMWLKEAQREREASAQRSGLPLSAKDKERERSRRESAVTRKRAEVYIAELENAARRLPHLEQRIATLTAALHAATVGAGPSPAPVFTSPASNNSPPSSTDARQGHSDGTNA